MRISSSSGEEKQACNGIVVHKLYFVRGQVEKSLIEQCMMLIGVVTTRWRRLEGCWFDEEIRVCGKYAPGCRWV